MKYLLTILILGVMSCKKNADSARQEPAADPTAKNVTVKTIYSSPSVPNAYWTFELNIPDTNAVSKVYFKKASPSQSVFVIDKPKTKAYTLIQPGVTGPTGNPPAYYFFEWVMPDGSTIKNNPFEVVEK